MTSLLISYDVAAVQDSLPQHPVRGGVPSKMSQTYFIELHLRYKLRGVWVYTVNARRLLG